MFKYNDYELIYLVQTCKCEAALEKMFKKYRGLMYKNLHIYNINQADFDDALQEATILLYKIINLFDEKHGKTFTRFYELVLKRRFQYLKKREPEYILIDDYQGFSSGAPSVTEEIILSELSEKEASVYEGYYVFNQKVSLIAKNNGLNEKQVYNAIYRIKEKVKSMI